MSAAGGQERLYGLLAVFDNADALLEAARAVREEGYERIDAYSPFPIEGMDSALKLSAPPFGRIAAGGFAAGALAALALQWWVNVVDYPINVGGRPLASWPAFAVPAFETGVLAAVIAVVAALLYRCRLPRLYHPLDDMPAFRLATDDRFFLCVEVTDPKFDRDETCAFLGRCDALEVQEVPA